MLPTLRGWKSASSHPRCRTTSRSSGSRVPTMQSRVVQLAQTSVSRTFTSSGERVEATKLNWPIGQTHLQNEAFLKTPSTTRAAAK